MGICSSSSSTASAASAKLILEDGTLREYSYPVKVSQVLQHANPCSPCFVCDADKLEYDGAFPAVSDDDELQPGQLYFAFPLSQLRRRVRGEEMAALAVKASSALTKSKSGVVFQGDGGAGDSGSGRRKSGDDLQKGKKLVQLGSIAE